MKRRILFFLKYYLPALLWAGVIFYFSNVPNFQATVTAYDSSSEIVLRKMAHFGEYAILAILVFRLFYAGYKFQARYAFWWTFVLAAMYAASDEFHQTFVPGRTGKVIDAFYDTGSILFMAELLVVAVRRKINMKNAAIILLALAFLFGLELKMLSDAGSYKVSLTQMKTDLGYMIGHEIDYVQGKVHPIEKGVSSETDTSKIEQGTNNIQNPIVNNNSSVSESRDGLKSVSTAEANTTPTIPRTFSIAVPFTSQAPLGIWDAVHEDTCEEASVLMLEYYVAKKTLTLQLAEKELQRMVAFENKNYGGYKDTTAAETAKLAADFYGLKNLKVVYDFKKDDLKKYLSLGKPIIVPAAGRDLKNPHYTPPGPLYHNLVLTGYNGDKIITNDPGTKHGENYDYDIDTLYNAIHDFPGDAKDIEQGRKAMIVLE